MSLKQNNILFRSKTLEHLDLSQLDIQIDGQSVVKKLVKIAQANPLSSLVYT